MARLKGPLMSLQASGSLADTLVFADWKGIAYARSKVDPSNPNTAKQQTQRGYLKAAVTRFQDVNHSIGALGLAALNRAANYAASVMSGFNWYIKNQVDTAKAAASIHQMFNPVESNVTDAAFTVVLSTVASCTSIAMFYGTSPTAMLNLKQRTEGGTAGTTHTFTCTGLAATTTYYYKIISSEIGSSEVHGVGKLTTAA